MARREELHRLQQVNRDKGHPYLTVPLRAPVSVADLEVPATVHLSRRKRVVSAVQELPMPYRTVLRLTEPRMFSTEVLEQVNANGPGEIHDTLEWTTDSMKMTKAPTDLVFRFMKLKDRDRHAVVTFVRRFGPVSTAPTTYVDRDTQGGAIVWRVAEVSECWRLAAEMNAVALISADLRERGVSKPKDWKALAQGGRAFGTMVNPSLAWGEDPTRDLALAQLPVAEQWNEITTWVNGWLKATDLKPSVAYDRDKKAMVLHYEGPSGLDYQAELAKYSERPIGMVVEHLGGPPTSTFRALVFQFIAVLSRAHVYGCSRCGDPFPSVRKVRVDRAQYCDDCKPLAKNERNQVWYRNNRKKLKPSRQASPD